MQDNNAACNLILALDGEDLTVESISNGAQQVSILILIMLNKVVMMVVIVMGIEVCWWLKCICSMNRNARKGCPASLIKSYIWNIIFKHFRSQRHSRNRQEFWNVMKSSGEPHIHGVMNFWIRKVYLVSKLINIILKHLYNVHPTAQLIFSLFLAARLCRPKKCGANIARNLKTAILKSLRIFVQINISGCLWAW